MHRSRMAFALGLVGPLLVLGGCSGNDPQPKIAPPESTAPTSASPSPSGPVPPTMPAAAKRHNAAGAEAFVSYYWDLVNYAQATGDTSGLEAASDPNCGACQGGLQFLNRIFEAGGTVRGGLNSVSDLEGNKVRAGDHVAFRVLASVANTGQRVDLPGRKRDKRYPAATLHLQFILDPGPDSWTVAFWDEAPS